MIKKLFLLVFVAVAFTACNNTATTDVASTEDGTEILSVDILMEQIDSLVDQEVVVQGTVDHVCKHGGGKMVIFTDDPEVGIHIMATDESGKFRGDEVMGEVVKIFGVVSEFRIDEGYIAEKEAELEEMKAKEVEEVEETPETEAKEEEEHKHAGGDFPDNDNKHKKEIKGMENQIANLKESLAEEKAKGKNHISYYSVKCNTYEIIPTEGGKKEAVESHGHVDNAAEAASDEEHKHVEGEEHEHEEGEGHNQ